MKRSRINDIIRESDAFIRSFGFLLPPFAYWSPEQMRAAAGSDIHTNGLGWDITDYGQGRFEEMGLFLFTTRNGKAQLSPMHRHNLKAEDIINRGGGDLIIELYAPAEDLSIDRTADVTVPSDGMPVTLPAGGHLRLAPGQSVTLMPGVWHAFWAEKGDCLIGEVSTVNDDTTDNVFEQEIGRFPNIEEDEAPLHLLVPDY